jgi:dephospho-CoA kinase
LETGGDSNVDLVVVVSAPGSVQRERALAREGMTEVKLEAVLSRQTSDVEKRRRAHFIIDTRGSLDETRGMVAQFMRATAALVGGRARDA